MIKKCVIPLGGLGTRFFPITKTIPKTMLSIVDKPVIHYLVKEALESGIEEVMLILNPNATSVIDYFTKNDYLNSKDKKKYLEETNYIIDNIKFHFTFEEEPKGSAHAIYLAKDFVKDDYFALMFGDDLFDSSKPVLKNLIEDHSNYNCNVIGVREVLTEKISSYGCVSLNGKDVINILEKPKIEEAPSNLAVVGRYILNNSIFKEIENLKPGINNEYQITDAIKVLIEKERMVANVIDQKYYDIGSKEGYIKANIDFSLENLELKDSIIEFIKTYE